MGIKALFVFNNAMALMDEFSTAQREDGRYAPNENDTLEYKARTIPILNILIGELFPFSDNFPKTVDNKRPICERIRDIEDEIPLDDYCAITVLPYGLAAHLLIQEDPATANYFQQRYEELKSKLSIGLPSVSEDIVDVYSGGYYDEDGNWHNGNYPYNDMAWW